MVTKELVQGAMERMEADKVEPTAQRLLEAVGGSKNKILALRNEVNEDRRRATLDGRDLPPEMRDLAFQLVRSTRTHLEAAYDASSQVALRRAARLFDEVEKLQALLSESSSALDALTTERAVLVVENGKLSQRIAELEAEATKLRNELVDAETRSKVVARSSDASSTAVRTHRVETSGTPASEGSGSSSASRDHVVLPVEVAGTEHPTAKETASVRATAHRPISSAHLSTTGFAPPSPPVASTARPAEESGQIDLEEAIASSVAGSTIGLKGQATGSPPTKAPEASETVMSASASARGSELGGPPSADGHTRNTAAKPSDSGGGAVDSGERQDRSWMERPDDSSTRFASERPRAVLPAFLSHTQAGQRRDHWTDPYGTDRR